MMCGVIGFTGFHSLPYWGISVFMGAILLSECITQYKKGEMKVTLSKSIFAFVVLVTLITPYFSNFSSILPTMKDFSKENNRGTYAYYIDKITNENDPIQVCSLETDIYLDSNRIPATIAAEGGACPWIYEVYRTQIFNGLKDSNPKVIVFRDDYDVWGYKYKDFAKDIVDYVKENYTQLAESGLPALYVKNDFYKDAVRLLDE
ncbi:MAG: hypothetical protein ACYCX2_10170 [Christensenellales bacterium]